jgi:predicted permease
VIRLNPPWKSAIRALRQHRAITAVAILSFSLAIALNATMYSMLDALINPRVEMRAPERLFWLDYRGDARHRVPDAMMDSLIAACTRACDGVAEYKQLYVTSLIAAGARSHTGDVVGVSVNYLTVAGIRLEEGRGFGPGDAEQHLPVVLISHSLAHELFARGVSPLGQRITVQGEPRVVIGVMGRNTNLPHEHPAVYEPIANARTALAADYHVTRLRDGAARADLESELEVIAARIVAAGGGAPGQSRFLLRAANDPQFHVSNFHYALIGAVLGVLLVACGNLANVQLARGIARARELAIRSALGADRRDLVLQLVRESALLAALGLALGLILTVWATHLIAANIPSQVESYVVEPQLTWRTVAVAALAAAACLGIAGLAPAIRVSRVNLNDLIKRGSGTGATRSHRRQYARLVVVEVALSLALAAGASVLVRVAWRADSLDLGYRPDGVTYALMTVKARDNTSAVPAANVMGRLIGEVEHLPGVTSAALHYTEGVSGGGMVVEDEGGSRRIPAPLYSYNGVTADYFRTMGLPLLRGRGFDPARRDEPEVMIDQHTARRLWPNADPVGRRIKLSAYDSLTPWVRVIGVVGDVVNPWSAMPGGAPGMMPFGDIYYLPGVADSIRAVRGETMLQLFVRADHDSERMPVELLQRFRSPTERVLLAEPWLDASGVRGQRRVYVFIAELFAIFAAAGLALAALGVYGIVLHSVAERRREFGVRVALGASPRDIVAQVMRESNLVTMIGIAAGLIIVKYSIPLLSAFSFFADRFDAGLFAAVAAGMLILGAASTLVPAVRAAYVNPVESLRND